MADLGQRAALMTIATGVVRRHEDISGVSGTGDVAELAEFSDGAVAVRWPGDHPSTACWNDIRDVEFIHGHQGATEILFTEEARLLAAYQRVVPFLIAAGTPYRPVTCAPHPDHPDRLRLTFQTRGAWRYFVALLDGRSDAATHEEVNGETEHRWVSADGNVWLVYYGPLPDADPLETYDKEDR